jgi:hypothetical protein
MKYAAYCEHPLDDKLVLVEASGYEEAKEKIIQLVSLVSGCPQEEVMIYNCYDENEKPEMVLHFETGFGGEIKINDRRTNSWATNPLILLGDKERKAAYQRFYQAMQDKATYDAELALNAVKNK